MRFGETNPTSRPTSMGRPPAPRGAEGIDRVDLDVRGRMTRAPGSRYGLAGLALFE
jgi:hypothetical protein